MSKSAYYRQKEEFLESNNWQSSRCLRRGKLSGTVTGATVRNKRDLNGGLDADNAKDYSVDLQTRDVTLLSVEGMVH